jgi:hypothetical protein
MARPASWNFGAVALVSPEKPGPMRAMIFLSPTSLSASGLAWAGSPWESYWLEPF